MPAFFVVAGFFAAYLVQSRGPARFVMNRAQRIALPLIIFWIPLSMANSWASQATWLTGNFSFSIFPVDFGHLWFLYYLLVFYAVIWAFSGLWERLLSRKVSPTLTIILLVAIMPLIPGVFDKEGTLATSSQIIPAPGLLLLYGLVFFSGVIAFYQKEIWLEFMRSRAFLLLAILLTSFFVFFIIQDWELPFTGWVYSTAVVAGTYGSIGVFLRGSKPQGRLMKFLAESSYWVYLVHLPLVFFFLVIFSQLQFGAFATILLTISSTAFVGLIIYKLLVRHTPVSLLLNGKIHLLRKPESAG